MKQVVINKDTFNKGKYSVSCTNNGFYFFRVKGNLTLNEAKKVAEMKVKKGYKFNRSLSTTNLR